MKRIIPLFLIALTTFLLSGCDNMTKTLTCTNSVTSKNGLRTDIKYVISYKKDDVKMVTMEHDYNQDNVDGVGTGTDGTTNDIDTNPDGIVDGVVGDAIDDTADAILDIAGIKTGYVKRLETYGNIKGFTADVQIDNNNEYKIIYKFDLDKMTDNDLKTFYIDRDFNTLQTNYTNQGLTCK